MKKIIVLFIISALLICCLASCSVVVDDPGLANGRAFSGTYGELQWEVIESGTLTISGEGAMVDFDADEEEAAWIPHSGKVKKIVVNEGVTSVSGNAFTGFAYVTKITLPDTLEKIGEYAFSSCESLESVTLPKGVSYVDVTAFSNSGALEKINVDSENATYSSKDGVLYNKSGSKLIAYPMGRGSKSFKIPDGVTGIGSYAFNDVSALEKVTFPDGVISIGDGAFSGCISLKTVELPETLKVIATYAFANCTELKTLLIPDSVETIEAYAFSYCENLKEITVSRGVNDIKSFAFENAVALEKINVDAENTEYASVDGVLYSKDKKTVVRMPAAYASESYTVVAGTEVIGEGAFSCCSKLKNIELPSTVNKIGEMAFFETVIQSIRIPDGVTKLETLTFAFCSDLKTVFIPASVTEISSGAFDDAQFETVYFGGTKEQWQSCGGEAEVDVGVIKFNQK